MIVDILITADGEVHVNYKSKRGELVITDKRKPKDYQISKYRNGESILEFRDN